MGENETRAGHGATADEWTDEARGMTGVRCDTHDAHADRCTQVAVFSVEQDGETQHSCIDHVAGVLLAHSPRTPVTVRRLNHTIRGRVR